MHLFSFKFKLSKSFNSKLARFSGKQNNVSFISFILPKKRLCIVTHLLQLFVLFSLKYLFLEVMSKRKKQSEEENGEKKKTKQTTLTNSGKLSKEAPREMVKEIKLREVSGSGKPLLNRTTTEIESILAVVENEADYVKIISWNVNGLNGFLTKSNFGEYIKKEDPHIICLGETKSTKGKEPKLKEHLSEWSSDFKEYWNHSTEKKGYAGTMILVKGGFETPSSVVKGIGKEEHDGEGRTITLEFEKFFLVNCYVPNAGQGLKRLDYKLKWDVDFSDYLNGLRNKKHVILCGDLNVAHNEIDIENPKSNVFSSFNSFFLTFNSLFLTFNSFFLTFNSLFLSCISHSLFPLSSYILFLFGTNTFFFFRKSQQGSRRRRGKILASFWRQAGLTLSEPKIRT